MSPPGGCSSTDADFCEKVLIVCGVGCSGLVHDELLARNCVCFFIFRRVTWHVLCVGFECICV